MFKTLKKLFNSIDKIFTFFTLLSACYLGFNFHHNRRYKYQKNITRITKNKKCATVKLT